MTGWYDVAATLRAFAGAAERQARSPLYGWLCRGIGGGSYVEREVFTALAARGWGVTSPDDVDNVLRAVHFAILQRHGRDELASYYPSAGGPLPPDPRCLQLFLEFVRDHRTLLLDTRHLPQEANDPEPGWRMMHVLAAYAERPSMQLDLLNLHARAGLEVVTDLVGQPGGGSVLAPHRVLRRRGFDATPQRLGDYRLRDWLLAQCPPDDRERWGRTSEAVDLTARLEVVVGQADAVGVAGRFEPLPGATAVLFGSDLGAGLPALEAAVARRAGRTIWLADEVAPVIAGISPDPQIQRLGSDVRVTLLREYLDGTTVGSSWGADWIVGGWMALRGAEQPADD